MKNKLLDLLFPRKCPFCKTVLKGGYPVCAECAEKLPYTKNVKCCTRCGCPLPGEFSLDLCVRCHGLKRPSVEHVFVPLVYTGAARRAMISLKYYMHPSYAEAFAVLMAEKILAYEKEYHFDFVTFVPQNKKTHFLRGYNQSELIARRLAKLLKLPCRKCLIRTDGGTRQATLSAAERRKNVRKCYFPMDISLSGSVLLIDDVFTTGSTVLYCGELLKKMGCSTVYAAAALIRAEEQGYDR